MPGQQRQQTRISNPCFWGCPLLLAHVHNQTCCHTSMAKPPPALVGTPPTLAAAATPAMQPWHPLNFRNQARVWEAEQVNCCPAAGPPHARHAPRALPLSTLIAVCGVAQTPAVRALPDRRIMTVRRRRRRPR